MKPSKPKSRWVPSTTATIMALWMGVALVAGGCATVNNWAPDEPELIDLQPGGTYVVGTGGARWFPQPIRTAFDRPSGVLAPGTELTLVNFDAYQAQVQLPTGREVFVEPVSLRPRVASRQLVPASTPATAPRTTPRPRPSAPAPRPTPAPQPAPQPEPAEPEPEPEPTPEPEPEPEPAPEPEPEPEPAVPLPEMRIDDLEIN